MSFTLYGPVVLLQVYDMPRSVQFYCEMFGFEVVQRSPTYATEDGVELFHWCQLKRDGCELMLNTAYDEGERPVEEDRQRRMVHGDVGLFFGCPDVDAAYAELVAKGLKCSPPKDAWYGMRQLSFRDPDGFGVTLQWPVAKVGDGDCK